MNGFHRMILSPFFLLGTVVMYVFTKNVLQPILSRSISVSLLLPDSLQLSDFMYLLLYLMIPFRLIRNGNLFISLLDFQS